jgi:phospholipid/cholesterol/gamma-HCH transport system substrate-binding protein
MASKKHDFTRTEIMAGALVLATAVVLAGFIAVVQGLRPPEEADPYSASFSSIIGLKEGAEVRFGGMVAGRVESITPDPENQTKIRVSLNVKPGTPLNDDSIATIEQLSLTSEKHLEISTGTEEASPLDPGSEIKAVTKSGGFIDLPDLDGLVGGSENLIDDLRKLLGVQAALREEEDGGEELPSATELAGDLRKLLGVQDALEEEETGGAELASVAKVTGDVRDLIGVPEAKAAEAAGEDEFISLTDVTGEVGDIFDKYEPELGEIIEGIDPLVASAQDLLNELNSVLTDNRESIDGSLEGVESIVSELDENLEDLMASLQTTMDNAKGFSGQAAALLEDNRPVIEGMLTDLNKAVRNINALLHTLKQQPQAVLWGKPAEGRK